jgi:hypothetical protein
MFSLSQPKRQRSNDQTILVNGGNWKPGVVLAGNVSDEEADNKFPAGVKRVLPYLRMVAQPQ